MAPHASFSSVLLKAMKNTADVPYLLNNERNFKMFKLKKRIAVLAAAVIMILGITAFAATGVISTWYSSSSSRPDYRSLPSMEQVNKDIGYDVELIEVWCSNWKEIQSFEKRIFSIPCFVQNTVIEFEPWQFTVIEMFVAAEERCSRFKISCISNFRWRNKRLPWKYHW